MSDSFHDGVRARKDKPDMTVLGPLHEVRWSTVTP